MRTCLSEAGSGRGVLDALSLISRDIMARIGQDDALRSGERGMTVEEGMDPDGKISPLPPETDELVLGAESSRSGAEKSFSGAAKQKRGAEGCDRLQVELAGEGASCSDGTVRIPLEIRSVVSRVGWSYRFPLKKHVMREVGEVFTNLKPALCLFQGRNHKGDPLSVFAVFITELLQKPAFLDQPANNEICHGKDASTAAIGRS